MRVTKTKNDNIISDRDMRDKYVRHYEVLERVKKLLLVPGEEFGIITDVSMFYDVSIDSIQKIYQRNKTEIDMDGVRIMKANELIGHQCPISKSIEKSQFMTVITYSNGRTVSIPNRGIKVFPKRAILRIGMILTNSTVAEEIRNQLLNIEEKVSDRVKITDINEEQHLMLNIGMAYASGNIEAVMKATTEYNAFQNRHIQQLKNDNKALAGQILEWPDRKKLNAGIRKLAAITGIPFGNLWNELYKNLQYKYGICLKQRGVSPYLQWVKEEEWESVMKIFCAMCEAYEQSPTEMFQQKTPISALASIN